MASFYNIPVDSLRIKFFQRKNDTHNFKNITEEQIKLIQEDIENRKKIYPENHQKRRI